MQGLHRSDQYNYLFFYPLFPNDSSVESTRIRSAANSIETKKRPPVKPQVHNEDYPFLSAVKNLLPEHPADLRFFPVGNILGDGRNPDNAAVFIPDW